MNEIHYDWKAFNPIYLPLWSCEKRFITLVGGRGSGKTGFVAPKMVHFALSIPDVIIFIARKTHKSHRFSTFLEIKSHIQDKGLSPFFASLPSGKGDLTITAINGSQIVFGGLDDLEKWKGLKKVRVIWAEEGSELTASEYSKLNMLMRGELKSGHYQLWMTLNPEPSAAWVRERFFDKQPENSETLITTYRDNRFLDNEYGQELEALAEQNPELHKIYALGQWGKIEGIIYPEWETFNELPQRSFEHFFGMDFGYEAPTVIIECHMHEKDVYFTQRLFQKKLTNEDLWNYIDTNFTHEEKTCDWFADSAEPARIEELYRKGLRIYPADKSVKDGIDMMQRFRHHIHADSTEMQREWRLYCRKTDKNGNAVDEPVKMNDHAADAARYAVYSYVQRYGLERKFEFLSAGRRLFSR